LLLLQTRLKHSGADFILLRAADRYQANSGDTIRFGVVDGLLKLGADAARGGNAGQPGPDDDATQVMEGNVLMAPMDTYENVISSQDSNLGLEPLLALVRACMHACRSFETVLHAVNIVCMAVIETLLVMQALDAVMMRVAPPPGTAAAGNDAPAAAAAPPAAAAAPPAAAAAAPSTAAAPPGTAAAADGATQPDTEPLTTQQEAAQGGAQQAAPTQPAAPTQAAAPTQPAAPAQAAVPESGAHAAEPAAAEGGDTQAEPDAPAQAAESATVAPPVALAAPSAAAQAAESAAAADGNAQDAPAEAAQAAEPAATAGGDAQAAPAAAAQPAAAAGGYTQAAPAAALQAAETVAAAGGDSKPSTVSELGVAKELHTLGFSSADRCRARPSRHLP